jgi:hypothetical protein
MIGPSRRGCGLNAGEVQTSYRYKRGLPLRTFPARRRSSRQPSHGRRPRRSPTRRRRTSFRQQRAPHSVRQHQRQRGGGGVRRATYIADTGAARGPPVNQQTSPSGAKVVPRARAGRTRTQETTVVTTKQHTREARREHGDPDAGLLPRWLPCGGPRPDSGKTVGTDGR